MEKHCNTTHPSQSSSCGSVHPHVAGNVHASVRASGIEKEGSCPAACATSPMLVGRDRSFRNWSIYQYKSPRWVGPHKSTLAFMGQQALVPAEVWKFGEADPEFPLPCSKIVQGGNRRFGTRHDHVAHTSQWSQHRVQGFKKLCKRCQKPEQCRARSAMSQDTTSAVAWLPTATLSRAHSETSWKHQRLMNA